MVDEPRCVIDHSVPCRACSAPAPDQCPYRYLLGWEDEPDPAEALTGQDGRHGGRGGDGGDGQHGGDGGAQEAGTTTARPVISPAASRR